MLLQVSLCQAAPEWLIATDQPVAVAGNPFEIIVAGTGKEPLPDEIEVRLDEIAAVNGLETSASL